MAAEHRVQPFRDFPPVEPCDVPEKLSQTFLKKYEQCPRSGYLYVRFAGGASSHPLERGSLYHGWQEEVITTIVLNKENTMSPEQGRELMEHWINTSPYIVPLAEQDDLYGMAWNFCEVTWIDPESVVAIESMVEFEVGGRILRGKIDYASVIGTTAEVVDAKTAYFPKKQKELKTFQTAFYATGIALGSIDGAPVLDHLQHFQIREDYPRHVWTENGKPVLAYRDYELEREQLIKFRHYLEGLVARVEESFATWKFKAVPGSHCSECPARALCPLPDFLRQTGSNQEGFSFIDEPPEIENADQAAEVAIRREFMQKQVRKDGGRLRKFADVAGPIRFGRDLILEVVPTEKTELVTGKDELAEAIDKAVKFGAVDGKPFDINDFYKLRHGFSMTRRGLTETELAEEAAAEDPQPKEES